MLILLFRPGRVALVSAIFGLAACSPTFDWREVRPEGSGLVALFPCKPRVETRTVVLEGVPVKLSMQACHAGGSIFAIATGDTGNPARVGPVLDALLAAQAGNLGAVVSAPRSFQVPGMTPHPQARRVALAGRFPDAKEVRQETALFSRGTRVFQAVVMGSRPDAAAADTFFESFKLTS